MNPSKKGYWCIFFLVIFAGVADVTAQTIQEQRQNLRQLSIELRQDFETKKAEALEKAQSQGIPVRQEFEDGRVIELMRFEGKWPVYYSTANAEGATLIKTDEVYNGGAAGLNLSGSGQTLGLWDAGIPRLTHQEITGRVTVGDGSSDQNSHATLVAGTLIASGVNTNAKGMAFAADVTAYDWNSDTSEMSAAAGDAGNPLLVSVHPYQGIAGWEHGTYNGTDTGWYWWGDHNHPESFLFGYYDDTARTWDNVAHSAKNYLIVVASGNHRGQIYPGGTSEDDIFVFYEIGGVEDWYSVTEIKAEDPNFEIPGEDGGAAGYKTVTSFNLSKNVLSVGAVNSTSTMYASSSWGPTDDGRIKPDVVAKGVGVESSAGGSDTAYATVSGTSHSSPMIAGSAAVLLEHQENLHPGEKLLSSTLRALIIHTAEDLGEIGPDYEFGWGLMNTQLAAEVMTDHQTSRNIHIKELTLSEGETISLRIKAIGGASNPLRVTLAWTDPPVESSEIIAYGTLNDPTPMLVNDLDVKILNGSSTFEPYILDPAIPSQAATTGNNTRDNVEMVHIDSPAPDGIYTVQISHEGILKNGIQDFSLIITGNAEETFVQQIPVGNGEGWRFLSTPAPAKYGELLQNLWTQGPANSDFPTVNPDQSNIRIYDFDGSQYNYISIDDMNTSIPEGNGMAVFVYEDDNFDGTGNTWPKDISAAGMEYPSPVKLTTAKGLNPGNDVFSLLGNPFQSTIDFDNFSKSEIGNVVYVYDHSCDSFSTPDEDGGDAGGCFRAWNGTSGSLTNGLIAPFQGYFVFASGNNPVLTIPESAKSSGGTFYKKNTTVPVVQIAARINGKYTSDTWFSFAESGSPDRNNFDAPMLYPLDYHPMLSIYSESGGDAFHIKNLPVDFDKPLRIPIDIHAWQPNGSETNPGYIPMEGTVEMIWPKLENIPANWSLTLEDHHTGKITHLNRQNEYRFELKATANKIAEIPYQMNITPMKAKKAVNSRFTLHIHPFPTVDPFAEELPSEISLLQNYPNPFNPSTTIRYDLPETSDVTIDVFTIDGQKVATLVNSVQNSGVHSVTFDGSSLASGVYMYRLVTGNVIQTRRMILVK